MIHFALKKLSYHVKFDASCYYPISFMGHEKNTQVLFGLTYGWFKNFICVAWRPNEFLPDKIDLFAGTNCKGNYFVDYVHTIDVEKEYDFLIVNSYRHNFFGIEGYRMNREKEAMRIFKFSTHYRYPKFKVGFVFKGTSEHKISVERN